MDPIVSVVMANHNGARFLSDAIASVLAQSVRSLELIVSDDASTDDSVSIARRWADRDDRVRVVVADLNAGPAACRNRALDRARGEWLAVVDADDLLHPERFERMLQLAGDADLLADNILVFHDDPAIGPRRLLSRRHLDALGGRPVDLATFVRANGLFGGGGPALGFLKPMIRLGALRSSGVRYDPSLRVAEDYDLVARLLASGCVYRILPGLTYFYRKHGGSISHRLSRGVLDPMLYADDRFRIEHAALLTPPVRRALDWRRRSILDASAFEDLVGALRARAGGAVLSAVASRPVAALRLRTPLLDRARRLAVRRRPQVAGSVRPIACVISRQRVVGATNGSSAYLLALAKGLSEIGYELRLVSPSPATFGRWPALPLRPEMSLFGSVAFRGGIRIGSTVVATDPRTLWRALHGAADRLLARHGHAGSAGKAPYAIALPWSDDDLMFVAREARGACLVVADYAFGTEAIPYALGHERSVVVMHDLFSSMRPGSLVEPIAVGDEMRMLARADATIAIQEREAATVRAALPDRDVVLVPMPARPVAGAQPGVDGRLLFVGSDTAPNREGLAWFLGEVWPLIRAGRIDAVLDVAGSVCAGIAHRPDGVRLLGRVDCLDALYRDAAVVISPLKIGTGLKIKLVEALAHGKALVVTSVTLQGVEDCAADAVREADDPRLFASAALELLGDAGTRQELGERALAVAEQRFGHAACLDALGNLLGRTPPRTPPIRSVPVLIEEDA